MESGWQSDSGILVLEDFLQGQIDWHLLLAFRMRLIQLHSPEFLIVLTLPLLLGTFVDILMVCIVSVL